MSFRFEKKLRGSVGRPKIDYSRSGPKSVYNEAIQSQAEVPVKPKHPYAYLLAWCVMACALVPNMCAQGGAVPRHTGVPQDWSQSHIVFSRDALVQHPDVIYREQRVLHQAMQRWQAPNSDVFHGAEARQASGNTGGHRDWNEILGKGRLVANAYPAKYSFDPGAPPSCAGDFVVLGLDTAGVTGGQANLVAFNNLYSGSGGMCGAAPTVLFAYNTTTVTGGKIVTSPIISEDGTKIAFVESVVGPPASAIFHILTFTAGQGTIAAAAAAPAAMISLPYSTSAYNTASAPWIDYNSDIVYVGADNGKVYQITGVFKGTPTISGSPWPVLVSANFHLTPPVLDATLGFLMVGSANASLYQINTTTGALSSLAIGKKGATSSGIVAAPIVDVTNGTTFAVSANDGTSAVLVEADTASLTQLSKVRIGEGAAGGTAVALYQPAFNNQYFNNPANGDIRLCGTGTADTTPWQYSFGFTGRTMNTVVSDKGQLLTSTAARCTGWTEFFNPNEGNTDYFFFGLTQDCTAAGTAGGCVVELTGAGPTLALTFATVNGGSSGIVVDNYSTAGQASSIYLTAERINTAYKFTQNGLH